MAYDLHRTEISNKKCTAASVSMKDIVNSRYPLDPLEILGERNFNEPRKVDRSEVGSPVQEFFRDSVVFLTGGTGFMGKVILEKLLRSCPHIGHVYLLVRPKKGKNAEERLNDIFTDKLYKRLKHEVPNYRLKVTVLPGDCSLPGLGLSDNSRKTLIDKVNIIFHGAATVRFNEHIRVAMNINVSGTREVLNLARKITNLKAIAHISTAYSNCNRSNIEEKFYTPNADYEEVLEIISSKDDQTLQDITHEMIGDLPNTYTFTKSLAEDVIRREGYGLPILVFRPTVVISTYREPVKGWIDNVYGPIGLMIGIGTGVIHILNMNPNSDMQDMIPVDMAVNSLICATKETATKKNDDEIPIYICSSSGKKPINVHKLFELNKAHSMDDWSSVKAISYIWVYYTTNPYIYTILSFIFHIVPGCILDTLAVLVGEKPMLIKIYKKMGQAKDTLTYFIERHWTFTNNNTLTLWDTLSSRDKELFNFDIDQLYWDQYSRALLLGIRVYLLNEDIDTLPAARKKLKRLHIVHNILLVFFHAFLINCTWMVIKLIFRSTGLM